ncbi:MAG: hypothetical protein RLZZ507_1475 [Cyanobacteriota bacterium]|jgi:hypothetical protein
MMSESDVNYIRCILAIACIEVSYQVGVRSQDIKESEVKSQNFF